MGSPLPRIRFSLLLLSLRCVYALDPATPVNQYGLRQWDNRSGLPQNMVSAIAQTPDGYLWFGTQAGLGRFDGKRFETFLTITHPALSDNLINSVATTTDGSLWVQTPHGIQRFAGGIFEPPVYAGDGARFAGGRLFGASDGALWSSMRDSVLRYKNGKLRIWKRGPGGELPQERGSLREDREHRIWQSTGKALYRLEGDAFRPQPLPPLPGAFTDFQFDGAGSVVLSLADRGIAFVDLNAGRVTRTVVPSEGQELGGSLFVDRNGSLWNFGRDAEPSRIKGGLIDTLNAPDPIRPELLFEDREGNLWTAGISSGVLRISDSLATNVAYRGGKRNTAWAVFEDRSGTLWVGLELGLARYRGGRTDWIEELAGMRVATLADHPRGVLAGTSKGIFLVTTGGVELISRESEVRDLVPFGSDSYVVSKSGTWFWSPARNELRRLDRTEGRAFSPLLVPSRDGRFHWMAGRGRLERLGHDGSMRKEADSLPVDVTGLTADDPAGAVWVCGFSGKLWRYRNGALTQIPLDPKLRISDAVSLVDDQTGRLWMGTSNGVHIFTKQDLNAAVDHGGPPASAKRLGLDQGMRNAECNTLTNARSAMLSRSGIVWFATEGGAVGFDARARLDNGFPPKSRIEEVYFDGKQTATSPGGALTVGPGAGNFEIRYTGITMVAPDAVTYRYQLEGFDPVPVEAGKRQSAFYTNLPPDSYRFTVTAINSDGLASPEAATLRIEFRPYFYQATWFYALVAIGLCGTVGLVFRWRLGTVERRNELLEAAVTERTAELKLAAEEARSAGAAKSEFLAMMSHEIRTPLNGVVGMTNLMLDSELSPDVREFATIIRSSGESLMAILNDILDFSKIESGKLELEKVPFPLDVCVEGAVDVLAPRAAEKGLELLFGFDEGVPKVVCGDVVRLRQILLNLLSNAIKFTERGEVVVSVSYANGLVQFQVRDTGVGVPVDRLHRLFQSFSQVDSSTTRRFGGTGLGLAISQRLCELMGGSVRVTSTEGVGSTFAFEIPLEVLPEAEADTAVPVLAGRRILLVDENATNVRLQTAVLSRLGAETDSADSVAGALLCAETATYDAVLITEQLAAAGGAALAALRRMVDCPLILLTPNRTAGGVERAPFDAVLYKPIKPAQLLETVARCLRQVAPEVPAPANRTPQFDSLLAQRIPFRILVAEDNLVNQKVALWLLRKMGYEADLAVDGRAALEAVRLRPYDLILMDVQMPEMDGLEATAQIQRLFPPADRPWIIAMTANAMDSDREACLAAGMDGFLSKPIDVAALQTALERCAALVRK